MPFHAMVEPCRSPEQAIRRVGGDRKAGRAFVAPDALRCVVVKANGNRCRAFIAAPGACRCRAHGPEVPVAPLHSDDRVHALLVERPRTLRQIAEALQLPQSQAWAAVRRLAAAGRVHKAGRYAEPAKWAKPADLWAAVGGAQ